MSIFEIAAILIGLSALFGFLNYRFLQLPHTIGLVVIALAARWAAVFLPITILSRWRSFTRGAVPILTWGGLRGGIAVALALSLPANEYKPTILTITYAVVTFSIIVQGLTIKRLVERTVSHGGIEDA